MLVLDLYIAKEAMRVLNNLEGRRSSVDKIPMAILGKHPVRRYACKF